MTPLLNKMTAAAVIAPAMAAETMARLGAITARRTGAMLASRGDTAERPEPSAPVDAATQTQQAERDAVLDRAADALEARAEAMEQGAANMAGVPSDPKDEPDGRAGGDAAEAPSGAAQADLRPLDGTLTAVATAAETGSTATEPAVDTAGVVVEATGSKPKALEEMLPASEHPAE